MTRTEPLFQHDAYARSCSATVMDITDNGRIRLDRTVFYPTGGGQPGDKGKLALGGLLLEIDDTVKDRETGVPLHIPSVEPDQVEIGQDVEAAIDWDRRYRHMRVHTALHLLSVVVPAPVTGGQITADYGRLDFDLPEGTPDRDELAERLNALVAADHAVTSEWITDEELAAKPELVKTMSVKPPIGAGRVRLIRIGDIDLQPCGGTHVASTAEIGPLDVTEVKSKGARNKRIRIAFAGD